MKVYGIKIFIHSSVLKKSLIIFGIIDDIIVEFLNNTYINSIRINVQENIPQEEIFQKQSFYTFMASLVLKDFLILI